MTNSFVLKKFGYIMKKPYLIQRCNFDKNGVIKYDYMGSAEFEVGDQQKSMKRIFKQSFIAKEIMVNKDEKTVVIYLLSGNEFDFDAYAEYLPMLIDDPGPGKLALKEPSYINKMISNNDSLCVYEQIDFWFDFENDVFLSLSPEVNNRIQERLKVIKNKWGV